MDFVKWNGKDCMFCETTFESRLTSLVVKADIILVSLPAGAAFLAAAGDFVYSGSRPCGCGFRAEPLFFVAGFDVDCLTLLFVRVAGLIALRHGWFFLSGGTPWILSATPLRYFSHNCRRL